MNMKKYNKLFSKFVQGLDIVPECGIKGHRNMSSVIEDGGVLIADLDRVKVFSLSGALFAFENDKDYVDFQAERLERAEAKIVSLKRR